MEKQQFITYAESFLEHSTSMEMLCAADKKMENPILYLNEAARDFLQHGGVPTIHIPRGSDASVLLGQSIHFFHTNPERERNVFVALADGTIVQYDNMLKLGAWLLIPATRPFTTMGMWWPSTPLGGTIPTHR